MRTHACLEFKAECAECVSHDATCGIRCDICGERMCTDFGPEPAARCDAHPTCVDCAEIPPCRDCGEAIRQAHEGSDW